MAALANKGVRGPYSHGRGPDSKLSSDNILRLKNRQSLLKFKLRHYPVFSLKLCISYKIDEPISTNATLIDGN